MAKMPVQKPATSEQVVATPPEFIHACLHRLNIGNFSRDLAADESNTVVPTFIGQEEDSLKQVWHDFGGWQWLNPPFTDISPWAEKAWVETREGAQVAMLLPASVGANWWRDWVRGKAYITYLNNRIKFVGHEHLYPKDLALLLYAPYLEGGSCMWRWK